MSAPKSAQQLPAQTPNSNAPISLGTIDLVGNELTVTQNPGTGFTVTGQLQLFSYVTAAWRYLFGTFAQTSSAVDPTFSLTADVGCSQAQMQQLADQVALLSKQLGRST